MGADFQIKLTAEGKKIVKELEELAKLEVAVGYQEGVSYPDGTSVVEVALYNELGTVHSPSRPFIRDSLNGHKQEIEQFMQQQAKSIVNGKRAEEILKEIGVFQKELIQKEIADGNFVPNSPKTIRIKEKKGNGSGGTPIPLIDTGLMRQSVNFVVREKGSSD